MQRETTDAVKQMQSKLIDSVQLSRDETIDSVELMPSEMPDSMTSVQRDEGSSTIGAEFGDEVRSVRDSENVQERSGSERTTEHESRLQSM